MQRDDKPRVDLRSNAFNVSREKHISSVQKSFVKVEKEQREGRVHFSLYFRVVVKATDIETQEVGKNVEAGPESEATEGHFLLSCACGLLIQLSYTIQDHLPALRGNHL